MIISNVLKIGEKESDTTKKETKSGIKKGIIIKGIL